MYYCKFDYLIILEVLLLCLNVILIPIYNSILFYLINKIMDNHIQLKKAGNIKF